MYDFITIDFETANNNLNSACSVGLVAVQGLEIVKESYFLIKPPTPKFNKKNISIHGITYSMVEDAETFAEIWSDIKELLDNAYYVLAHNANFDMSVLRCCLDEYSLENPDFLYLDSINIIRLFSGSDLHSYDLETSAAYYSVDLGIHHNAMNDARALANIIIQIMKNNEMYCFKPLLKKCQAYTKWFSELNARRTFGPNFKIKLSDSTIAMQELKSFATDIISDGIVEIDEINALSEWISEHPSLSGNYPFDKISELCDSIFEDGIISDEERKQMFALLNHFVDPIENTCCSCSIDFPDKIFVLSGDFISGSKKEIECKITDKGGICNSSLTKKVDYLIVGGAGNDNWKFGNYGAKVSKALAMQEKGHHIVILKESDLMNCFK